MDYTLRISGDFERGDCMGCPCGILSPGGFICGIDIENAIACPLEEATVAKNATVEEVPDTNVGKKGKWIRKIDDDWFRWVECSLCGTKRFAPRDFCPNCGADMRGAKE